MPTLLEETDGKLYVWIDPELVIYTTDRGIYLQTADGRTVDVTHAWKRIMRSNPGDSIKIYLIMNAVYLRRKFYHKPVDSLIEEYAELIRPYVERLVREALRG